MRENICTNIHLLVCQYIEHDLSRVDECYFILKNLVYIKNRPQKGNFNFVYITMSGAEYFTVASGFLRNLQ